MATITTITAARKLPKELNMAYVTLSGTSTVVAGGDPVDLSGALLDGVRPVQSIIAVIPVGLQTHTDRYWQWSGNRLRAVTTSTGAEFTGDASADRIECLVIYT